MVVQSLFRTARKEHGFEISTLTLIYTLWKQEILGSEDACKYRVWATKHFLFRMFNRNLKHS